MFRSLRTKHVSSRPLRRKVSLPKRPVPKLRLFGVMISTIAESGRLVFEAPFLSKTSLTSVGVCRTMIVLFSIFSEMQSPYCRATSVVSTVVHLLMHGCCSPHSANLCWKFSRGNMCAFPMIGRVGGPGGYSSPRRPWLRKTRVSTMRSRGIRARLMPGYAKPLPDSAPGDAATKLMFREYRPLSRATNGYVLVVYLIPSLRLDSVRC
ncbi:hypothetical protein MPH_03096 [Macrophomina phaseolina MS6]|uniref:Uncharacterized protein n=1 Tax=Macrophomina phaseolina (strain MS6) TaxID=1126212 RepID=K2SSE8_MACPH|nr:hypothetical protein MPH_03096 [Macrophomina phaseolina MS6]